MYIKRKWFGLKMEVHASEREQDIIANELMICKKPVYTGFDAESIFDYVNDKLASNEALDVGNDEYELMRKVAPKPTKKSLGSKKMSTVPKRKTSKKKVTQNKRNNRKSK